MLSATAAVGSPEGRPHPVSVNPQVGSKASRPPIGLGHLTRQVPGFGMRVHTGRDPRVGRSQRAWAGAWVTQHMARGPGGGCISYPGSPEWAAVTKVALEEGAGAAPSAPEAGLEPLGADHTVSWSGGCWARCLCSLALVVERLLNTHEPEWVWGWPGRRVEDRRTRGTQAKGACEVVTASRHVLKLGLPGWAGFPLAIAQGPSLRAFSLLLQTFSQHVGVGAGMTRDPQGSGEAPMVRTRSWWAWKADRSTGRRSGAQPGEGTTFWARRCQG